MEEINKIQEDRFERRYSIYGCCFNRYIYDNLKQQPADLDEIVKILNSKNGV